MNFDPTLTGADRVGSLLMGLGLIAFALFGTLEKTGAQAIVAAFGTVFAIGGLGGT